MRIAGKSTMNLRRCMDLIEHGGFSNVIPYTPEDENMEHVLMEAWKIMFLSKWVICRFHVNLPGCSFQGYTIPNPRM